MRGVSGLLVSAGRAPSAGQGMLLETGGAAAGLDQQAARCPSSNHWPLSHPAQLASSRKGTALVLPTASSSWLLKPAT